MNRLPFLLRVAFLAPVLALCVAGAIPNDPLFRYQRYHTNQLDRYDKEGIYTPPAWDITTGSPDVIVAAMDTAFEADHPEFAGRILTGFNFVSGTTDVTDRGCIDGQNRDVGVIAATGNNGLGIAGVDWRCKVLPIVVRACGRFPEPGRWAQGVNFAVANGAKILHLFSKHSPTDDEVLAVENSFERQVIVVTSIRSPYFDSVDLFPGNSPYAITVGAGQGGMNYGSSGPHMDLLAVYEAYTIFLSQDSQPYRPLRGDGIPSAQVAGVCALLAALHPNITPRQARALLCAGADEAFAEASDTPGWDPDHGWGQLNAYATLLLSITQIDRYELYPDGTVRLSWRSPANARFKQPYLLEQATELAGPWTEIPNPEFLYATDRTAVLVAPEAVTFYRIAIKQSWPDGAGQE